MDANEFRKRVYSDPLTADQEVLDRADADPQLKAVLEQTQQMEEEMRGIMNSVTAPAGLKEQLLAIPDSEAVHETSDQTLKALADKPAANSSYFQYFAIAASLVLALGVTFSLTFNAGPSSAEIAFGNDVLEHLYMENAEISAINTHVNTSVVGMPMIRDAMAPVGTQLASNSYMESMPIRFAKPCIVIPAYDSAHLIIEGAEGAVNVFVINNSPVTVEYSIRDDRFNGVVIPMQKGNMIVIGEGDTDVNEYKQLFAESVDWVI